MKKQNSVEIEQDAHRSVAPQNIDEYNWYYEEQAGIEIIHQVPEEGGRCSRIDSILIPWDKLTKTVRRHLGMFN